MVTGCGQQFNCSREALRGSSVVKRLEGEEAVMDLNQWLSDSSTQEEEEEGERERVECRLEKPEKWE